MMSGVIRTRVRSRRRCRITSWPAACGIRCVKPSIATVSPSPTLAEIASASVTISATPVPHQPNDIERALGEQLCVLRSGGLIQDARRDRERVVSRRDTRVDRDLQQYLLDLGGGQAVAQRGPDVHGEFVVPAQRREGGQRDHAPLRSAQPGPCPDLPPGVTRDQILERRGELRRARDRPVHVLIAEHLAAHSHPCLRALGIVHAASLDRRRAPGLKARARTPATTMAVRWPTAATSKLVSPAKMCPASTSAANASSAAMRAGQEPNRTATTIADTTTKDEPMSMRCAIDGGSVW